jgi:hypothetical protein
MRRSDQSHHHSKHNEHLIGKEDADPIKCSNDFETTTTTNVQF